MNNQTTHTHSPPHTCWDAPDWDGGMHDDCAGCDYAAAHPCEFCGFGEVFTTHNPIAHAENGDLAMPAENDWTDATFIDAREIWMTP